MANSDFVKCEYFKHLLVCEEHHPLFTIGSENHCEVDIFLHDYNFKHSCNMKYSFHPQFWIELSKPNTWLFSIKEKLTVKLFCNNVISTYSIYDQGLIEIPSGCMINIGDAKIHGKNVSYSSVYLQSTAPFLPLYNISDDLPKKNSSKAVILKLDTMDSISESLQDLKLEESVDLVPVAMSIEHVDIHQRITYGLLLLILTVGMSFYCFKKHCSKTIKIKHINQDRTVAHQSTPGLPSFHLPPLELDE